MKLILLSDANSIHTQRWALSLSKRKITILLFSLFKPRDEIGKKYKLNNIKVVHSNINPKIKKINHPSFRKLSYFKSLSLLKKTIKIFKPDIIHSHYASSYGVLGYLTNFKPFILSVWGSDVYHFPYLSFLNKQLVKIIIKRADIVCSTSIAMRELIEKDYKRFDVFEVPFGIDTKLFEPKKIEHKKFTVGTIKSIEMHNGIDCILDAADIIINEHKIDIQFLIVGKGSLLNEMIKKAESLDLLKNVIFTGFVDHEKTINYYSKLSIFVAVSTRESFGVSILEAASCEIPSITSNIGGLKEVNIDNVTGVVIEPNEPKVLADSIIKLYNNKSLRLSLGSNGRERVKNKYNWNHSIDKMIDIYKSSL